MAEYIKREDAIQAFANEFEWILDMLERVPAADVVEVVRCGECKHRDPEDKKCDCGHDILWQLPRDDDWFCADGERREVQDDN